MHRLSGRAALSTLLVTLAVALAACTPMAPPVPTQQALATELPPVSTAAAATVAASPVPSTVAATPSVPSSNVAAQAQVVTWGKHPEQARNAVDGNPDTFWWSESAPKAWIGLIYDRPYEIERIELLVAQTPAGQTTHEVYLGHGPDLSLVQRLAGSTADGQTLTIPVTPTRAATRVLVRTLISPSQVAWREVRVFGRVAGQPAPSARLTVFSRGGPVDSPVGVTHASDGSGRLFVLQQQGRIWVLGPNGERRSQPFLEMPERVSCCTERGLLGLAFPPGYQQKRYAYVSYTSVARSDQGIQYGDLVISRFRLAADADALNPRSEEVLLVIPQASGAHHGGKLEFGPRDGLLYISSGDGGPGGGAEGRALRTDNLQGKLLRVDVESGQQPYAVPPSNPHVGQAGFRPEILAHGLRNPWGMVFDPVTGDLFIADAGETEWEEVNVHRAAEPWGLNYGWPRMEGRHCHPLEPCDVSGTTLPVVDYHHLEGCVITGGAVARAARYQRLQGAYVFADFCSGRLWTLREEQGRWVAADFGTAGFPISTIGRDEAGNVYVADYTRGQIWLIED